MGSGDLFFATQNPTKDFSLVGLLLFPQNDVKHMPYKNSIVFALFAGKARLFCSLFCSLFYIFSCFFVSFSLHKSYNCVICNAHDKIL